MKRLMAVLALGASLIAAPAAAQDAEPSERANSLAAEYVELIDIEGLFYGIYEGSIDAIPEWRRLLQETIPGLDKNEDITAEMPTLIPEGDREMLRPFFEIAERLLAETYARTYTEDQLAALVRFHTSPEGRGILERQDEFWIMLVTVMIQRAPEIREELGLEEETWNPGLSTPPSNLRSMTPMGSNTWPSPTLQPPPPPIVIEPY